MKSSILNIAGVEVLTSQNQKNIMGGLPIDYSQCGCDCAGRVTGPKYCLTYIACLQVYTCNSEI